MNTRVASLGKLSDSRPLMVTRSASETDVIALTPAFPLVTDAPILVPGQDGLKEFLIHTGILFFITGWMVFGWSTLAPKNESSMASR